MLQIVVPEQELYVPSEKRFYQIKRTTLNLEHSLISLSKWEAKYKKPFLDASKKTVKETLDYIHCMTINPTIDDMVYLALTNADIARVEAYIADPMTATRFTEYGPKRPNKQIITSELIYYWMVTANIPFECQKWHLNRLLTLIRICGEKSNPKKMSRRDAARSNAALNAARRAAAKSHG